MVGEQFFFINIFIENEEAILDHNVLWALKSRAIFIIQTKFLNLAGQQNMNELKKSEH